MVVQVLNRLIKTKYIYHIGEVYTTEYYCYCFDVHFINKNAVTIKGPMANDYMPENMIYPHSSDYTRQEYYDMYQKASEVANIYMNGVRNTLIDFWKQDQLDVPVIEIKVERLTR